MTIETVDELRLFDLIRDRIVAALHPLKIVVFGSRARGNARKDSDVDVLVVLPGVGNKRDAAIAIRRLLSDLPVGKDVVVTSPEEIARRGSLVGSVLRPALREGRTIFERT